MIDKMFYKFFDLIDRAMNWLYDKFVCDLPKDKNKKKK